MFYCIFLYFTLFMLIDTGSPTAPTILWTQALAITSQSSFCITTSSDNTNLLTMILEPASSTTNHLQENTFHQKLSCTSANQINQPGTHMSPQQHRDDYQALDYINKKTFKQAISELTIDNYMNGMISKSNTRKMNILKDNVCSN